MATLTVREEAFAAVRRAGFAAVLKEDSGVVRKAGSADAVSVAGLPASSTSILIAS